MIDSVGVAYVRGCRERRLPPALVEHVVRPLSMLETRRHAPPRSALPRLRSRYRGVEHNASFALELVPTMPASDDATSVIDTSSLPPGSLLRAYASVGIAAIERFDCH